MKLSPHARGDKEAAMQIKLEDIAGYYLRLEGNRLICPGCFKARYGGEVDLDMILIRETVEKKCHLFFCDECREQIC